MTVKAKTIAQEAAACRRAFKGVAVGSLALNAEALTAMRADRDDWQTRYQRKKEQYDLLDELLHETVLTSRDPSGALSIAETFMTLLETGTWRAICPTCREIDCVGGGTSRCSQEACEHATGHLTDTYTTWAKMGDV